MYKLNGVTIKQQVYYKQNKYYYKYELKIK